MVIVGDTRLLSTLALVLRDGGLEAATQAAALVQRLWSHDGAAAVLAGQHVALVDVAADMLWSLGVSVPAPDARSCALALDAVRSCLPALACLSLVHAPLPASATVEDGGSSLLVSALRSLDSEEQARATHALAELAGLRRAVPALSPRFTLEEGDTLLSEAALRVATPAQRAELRGVARQVVAALAGGHSARVLAGGGDAAGAGVGR